MKKEKKLFLSLIVCLALLFALATVSIIFVFVVDFTNTSENIMATVYLFAHSIVVAGAFYFAFKAFIQRSQLMRIFMLDEYEQPLKKSKIVCIVLSSLSFLIGIYFTLLVFGLQIPLNEFAKGLKYALMNVGYSVGIVTLHFALYPTFYSKELYEELPQ